MEDRQISLGEEGQIAVAVGGAFAVLSLTLAWGSLVDWLDG